MHKTGIIVCLLLMSLAAIAWHVPFASASVSLKSTLSTGYYRDAEQDSHVPAYLYWNFNHVAKNGIETFLNVGLNNAVMEDLWRIYVYEAMLSFPIWQGFEDAPYRTSRLQVGRQLFYEGFELSLLDGLQLPFYWSQTGGMTLAAGSANSVYVSEPNWESQVYGGTVHENFAGALWKAGYFFNYRENQDSRNLVEASVLKIWNQFFLHPMVFLRGQTNLPSLSLYQSMAEIQLVPLEDVTVNVSAEGNLPNQLLPENQEFIYSMFAAGRQNTYRLSTAWAPGRSFHTEASLRYILFDSQKGDENANHYDLSIDTIVSDLNLGGQVGHIRSYGGEVSYGGVKILKSLSHKTKLRLEGSMAWVDKINQIQGWAYHGRSGMDFRLASRFILSALAEVERNHLFDMDARAILYVSHFYF